MTKDEREAFAQENCNLIGEAVGKLVNMDAFPLPHAVRFLTVIDGYVDKWVEEGE